MTATTLLILYPAVIVVASLIGGLVPSLFRFSHRGLQFVLSTIAGVMLGVGLFHMLPHAIMIRAEAAPGEIGHGLLDPLMLWAVLGFVTLFLLERFFHFHQHEPDQDPGSVAACDHPGHDHSGHAHAAPAAGERRTAIGWFGALVGLGVHSILEGVALAASVAVGFSHGGDAAGALAGLATFLVILFHKPFDSLTLATLMRRSGAPLRLRILANVLLAALVPAGVGIFLVGAAGGRTDEIAAPVLAFSAGMFLCIASSDLLPELQFHRHDRVGLSAALIAGLALAFGLARLEASTHVHAPGVHDHSHDHDHDHDHGHSHSH
jgi:zinc and cadmium transporter